MPPDTKQKVVMKGMVASTVPSSSVFSFLVDAIFIREDAKYSKSATLAKDSVAVFRL
jgi:hypothetical protein